MSGWGRAEGGKSYYALEVESLEEAGVVALNAHAREEMTHVRFTVSLPTVEACDHLSVGNRGTASRWYEPDGYSSHLTAPSPKSNT